jgi:ferredoxin
MANIIHYRDKCIGCCICYEMQPEIWRMSKKDGKATLLNAKQKKSIYLLPARQNIISETESVAEACPVKIIKVL